VLFAGSPLRYAAAAVLLAMLLAACVWDVRVRRIPNRLTASIAALGLLFTIWQHPNLGGLGIAFGGLAVGLLVWFPSYAFGLLGAGDVKLAAAAGMWLGPMRTFEAAIIGGIIGGALALLWMLRFRGVRGTATSLWVASVLPRTLVQKREGPATRQHVPYSVALCLGIAIVAWMPKHLF
jgi:Flp pilus assembly protein protease CpaA